MILALLSCEIHVSLHLAGINYTSLAGFKILYLLPEIAFLFFKHLRLLGKYTYVMLYLDFIQ